MSEPQGGPGAHAASDRQSGASPRAVAGAGVVAGEGVGVSRRLHRFATDAARREAGGIDWWATIAGTLAALGTAVLLGGLFAAGGVASALNKVAGKTQLSVGGAIAGLVTLLIAFYVGGWVAGRMARYDGARNGLLTAVWFLVLGGALAALGATAGSKYNVVRGADVPAWFDRDVVSTAGIVYAVLALVVVLGAAILGGIVGARWHRKADDALLGAREGALGSAYPVEPGASTRRLAGTVGTAGTAGTADEVVIRPEERR